MFVIISRWNFNGRYANINITFCIKGTIESRQRKNLLQTGIKMFNIRLILFTSHYTFRSTEKIKWSTNAYVVIELSIIWTHFLHLPKIL
jgi:hypothetical protein